MVEVKATRVTISATVVNAMEVGRIDNKILDHGHIKTKLYVME